MKQAIVTIIVAIVILAVGGALLYKGTVQNDATSTPKAKQRYYCTMHPEYTSDRPGDCPICGMKLEPLKEDGSAPATSGVSGYATVHIDPEQQQKIGVRKGKVESRPVTKTVRAIGVIGYNERKVHTVNIKFGGWIDKAGSDIFAGTFVKAGTPLFGIYSPELVTAQREYLAALEAEKKAGKSKAADLTENGRVLAKATRQKLLFWDISEEQIDRIARDGTPAKTLWISSPADGFIIGDELTNGKYVAPGETIFKIADLSTVWIEADIYEYEVTAIDVGDTAEIAISSYPGEAFTGAVTYIYPYLNPTTRTVKVRIELPNPEHKLKIDMYADHVTLKKDLGEKVVIPVEAVMDTGSRRIVFVDKGDDHFEPREVTLGLRTGDGAYEVLSGVHEGETVVVSGNFLIDSESKMKSAQSQKVSEHNHGGNK